MSITHDDIREWFKRGKRDKATHLLVVCDTFDYDDYPVFVSKGQDAQKVYDEYNGKNMQRVMEVYNLCMAMESQINEHRAFNF